jgi:hypothetical protein
VILEQSGQEALRAREEMLATDAAENPSVTPAQDRSSLEAQTCAGEGVTHV